MTHKCSGDPPEFIRKALGIIGDKWTALILRRLHEGPKRFTDLENEIEGINPRTLSQRLEKLTDKGLIEKESNDPRSAYALTEMGEDFDSVLHQMALWGKKYTG